VFLLRRFLGFLLLSTQSSPFVFFSVSLLFAWCSPAPGLAQINTWASRLKTKKSKMLTKPIVIIWENCYIFKNAFAVLATLSLHYSSDKRQACFVVSLAVLSLCLLLDKNHRPLLYSDRKHSWNDPSASLIFLGMAMMIKCRFAFPRALAACCAVSRACCLIQITGHCCTVITRIALKIG